VASGLAPGPASPPRAAKPATIPATIPSQDATDTEALSAGKRQKLKRAMKRLRNSNEAARIKAEADVIAFGRGALPDLLDATTTNHDGQQLGLAACLVALTDERDVALVADSLSSDPVALRRFAARKAGDLGTAELLDALPARLEDEDARVAMEAALSLARHGREDGLVLLAAAYDGEGRPRIDAALEGVRNVGPHRVLMDALTSDPDRLLEDPDGAADDRIRAVAMLAAIGDQASIGGLVKGLDDQHNLVQREAINGLRRVLEDKPPMEAGSIFGQINEVERLKEVAASRGRR